MATATATRPVTVADAGRRAERAGTAWCRLANDGCHGSGGTAGRNPGRRGAAGEPGGGMIVHRRSFVVAMGVLLTPALARAQPVPGRTARLGILVSETTVGQAGRIDALRAGLAERGYVEGRNIAIALRSAESDYDRLPRLAAELANGNVDVIVAFGIKALAAARSATATVPIVIPATSGDLVALGFARTLARPGGNVTGSTTFGSEVMT